MPGKLRAELESMVAARIMPPTLRQMRSIINSAMARGEIDPGLICTQVRMDALTGALNISFSSDLPLMDQRLIDAVGRLAELLEAETPKEDPVPKLVARTLRDWIRNRLTEEC